VSSGAKFRTGQGGLPDTSITGSLAGRLYGRSITGTDTFVDVVAGFTVILTASTGGAGLVGASAILFGIEKVTDFDAQDLRDVTEFQDGDIPAPVLQTVGVGPIDVSFSGKTLLIPTLRFAELTDS
jgi:hypothetical protein